MNNVYYKPRVLDPPRNAGREWGHSLVAVGHASHRSLVAAILVVAELELSADRCLTLPRTDGGTNVRSAISCCSATGCLAGALCWQIFYQCCSNNVECRFDQRLLLGC